MREDVSKGRRDGTVLKAELADVSYPETASL